MPLMPDPHHVVARGRGRVEIEGDVPVGGEVRLMTDEPIHVASPDAPPPLRDRLSEIVSRRPWILPAAVLAIVGVALMVRRLR
jgi:hypothetical protein